MSKKYEEMNTVEVLDMLKDMFPNFKAQLQDAIYTYERPLEKYCEAEAAFQLDEAGYKGDDEDRKRLESIITKKLFDSSTFIDGEVAYQITEDAINDYIAEKNINLIRFGYCYKGVSYIIRARNTMEALGKCLTRHPLANHLTIDRRVKDNDWKVQYHSDKCFNVMMREINYECQRAGDEPECSFLVMFKYNGIEYHCIINNAISMEEALGVFFFTHPNIRYLDICACVAK